MEKDEHDDFAVHEYDDSDEEMPESLKTYVYANIVKHFAQSESNFFKQDDLNFLDQMIENAYKTSDFNLPIRVQAFE